MHKWLDISSIAIKSNFEFKVIWIFLWWLKISTKGVREGHLIEMVCDLLQNCYLLYFFEMLTSTKVYLLQHKTKLIVHMCNWEFNGSS